MTTAPVADAIEALVQRWTELFTEDNTVQVFDGPTTEWVGAAVVGVGVSVEDTPPTEAAERPTFGGRMREQFDIGCTVVVGSGQSDVAAARRWACTIYNAIRADFRGNRNMPNGLGKARITAATYTPDMYENGLRFEIAFVVRVDTYT